ncbi:MAG: FAD binding domain-containing protein [Elusimicrobia bacterium]|nr:FAD binding domain-containing protein [Elusimicrobiota bacterium]
MRAFSYIAPENLQQALSALDDSSRPLAGGTDLVTLMKADLAAPERLVSVRRLLPAEVRHADGVFIGAGTTLSEIEANDGLRERYTALGQAAAAAASLQLRNVATLGGNLMQRPRCWYFRNPRVQCWLKGGEQCPAREGRNRLHALFSDGPCVAVHPSDLAPALLAFDAGVQVRGPQGERALSLDEFFAMPEAARRTETRLAVDELVLSVRLLPHPAETKSTYLKAMDRQAFSFALASVAAVLRLSPEGRVGHARLVLGGVAPIPWRARAAERTLFGAQMSEESLGKAAEAAVQEAVPLRHNAYKIPLVRALVKRALRKLV